MPVNDIDELKQKVQSFLIGQPLYNSSHAVKVVCEEGHLYHILYGYDMISGVPGFGQTPEGVFNDFTDNWDTYRTIKSNEVTA